MKLYHLPVDRSQGLDVDGMRLWGIQVQLYAHFVALVQPDQPGEGRIHLYCGNVLLTGCWAVPQPIPVYHGRKPALALHARPSHEYRLLRGCIACIRGAGRGRLTVGELDDDILRDLRRMCQCCELSMAGDSLPRSHSRAPRRATPGD